MRGVEFVAIHNAPMDPGPAETLRILVVEDDRALRAVLVSTTEAAGHQVVAVGDGLAATRELRARPFDVVLLDIGLPVVDGWHILGELEGRRIPSVIVISARGEERDKVRALDLGTGAVHRAGEEVRLSPTERALVVELARHAGRVVDHRTLLRRVWGPEYAGERNYLRTFVQRLRLKLEADPSEPRLIVTVEREGYRFGPAPPPPRPAPPRGG